MRHYTICFLFILLFLSACNNNSPKSPFDFPANGKPIFDLKSEKVYFPEVLSPYKIERKGKFLIVIENRSIPLDKPIIHIIETETLNYIMSKGVNGLGPNEITDAHLFDPGFSDSTFWVNSTGSKRMAEFSLYDTSQLSVFEFKQPQIMYAAYKTLMLTDSTFLSIAASDSNRFVEYGMNGKRITGYGSWEPIPNRPGLSDFIISEVHAGWFKVDREANLFVNASTYHDRLDIFNYNTKKSIIVDGPRLAYPHFDIAGSGAGVGVIFGSEAKYGHRDIAFGEKYMYDLYGGYSDKDYKRTGKLAETIFILTKEGVVVAKLNLDRSLFSITVDEYTGKIYGITTDEDPGIAVFDIPKELLNKQE
ncbi:BF3164 family lipoprotein [Roseivirga echinicomitans]